MEIHFLTLAGVDSLSFFIAQAQQQPEHYVGYVSENVEDIAQALGEIDGVFDGNFLVAKNGGEIQGFIGVDLDEDARAWIYEPICRFGNWNTIANGLWSALEPRLAEADAWLLFADEHNNYVASFAEQLGCAVDSREYIMEFKRDQVALLPKVDVNEIRAATPSDHQGFVTLHDTVFPNTYYHGAEILERMSPSRALFVTGDSVAIEGYSYAEVSDHGEAYLEFIGVSETQRGRGTGQRLMTATLQWIFAFPQVHEVQLTVSAENIPALRMYERLGFTQQRAMVSYRRAVTADS